MEDIPKIKDKKRLPLDIEIHPYLYDHHFEGKPVLPAVEALQSLAISTKEYRPEIDVACMYNASFPRFISIKPDEIKIKAFNEIELYENGDVISKLITIQKSKSGSITRSKEHVIVKYKKDTPDIPVLPYDIASTVEGICFEIKSTKLYEDLVPFGPSYQNAVDTIYLSNTGASGNVSGATFSADNLPLGSPFPIDAAFHIACAWGQRYHGIVGFPTGFQRRLVIKSTRENETYYCRIIPVETNDGLLIFDIHLYDREGNTREVITGLKMEDVSRGRLKPPEWIMRRDNKILKFIKDNCDDFSVVELNTISNIAEKALSEDELKRHEKMRDRRIRSFMGARMACKLLSRKLAGNDISSPANNINTIVPDEPYPKCPLPDGSDPYICSVSHDKRFAIAVASKKRIGIDVEMISERVLKGQHHYMNDNEREIANSSSLGAIPASLRVWSIKEAVTKAFLIKLYEAWRMTEVVEVGQNMSKLVIDGKNHTAYHDTIDDHLFTVLELD